MHERTYFIHSQMDCWTECSHTYTHMNGLLDMLSVDILPYIHDTVIDGQSPNIHATQHLGLLKKLCVCIQIVAKRL